MMTWWQEASQTIDPMVYLIKYVKHWNYLVVLFLLKVMKCVVKFCRTLPLIWWCSFINLLLEQDQVDEKKTEKNSFIESPPACELDTKGLRLINQIKYIRSLPEEPHLAWVGVTFSDFGHLSWAYFLCKWDKILISWCQSLRQ